MAVWDDIKAVAADVLHRHRATITHHHAVGRDHRPTSDLQRPNPFALPLQATKDALDPHHTLNPGVLVDGPARPRAQAHRLPLRILKSLARSDARARA